MRHFVRHAAAVCVLLAVLAITARPHASQANDKPAFVVIVNAENGATSLERRFVSDAFLGKRAQWPKGKSIKAVDLSAKSSVRAKFTTAIHGRTVDAVRKYWAQQVFSGTGAPPPQKSSDEAIVEYVESHEGAIGYVSSGAALGTAKIVQVK
jgi:ABC-type phosphate transport system substrate-binding protein